jgi:hypothetical protein
MTSIYWFSQSTLPDTSVPAYYGNVGAAESLPVNIQVLILGIEIPRTGHFESGGVVIERVHHFLNGRAIVLVSNHEYP